MTPTIHHRDGHHGWDRELEPLVQVSSGDVVEVQTIDAAGGQLDGSSTSDHVANLDLDRANPLTGPIHVAGAQPGDTLAVHILELHTSGWGWTANIPGFGLLADDFPDPHVIHSRYDQERLEFGDLAIWRPAPFIGTIGVAPAEDGPHSVIPPRRVGGNMDLKDVGRDTTLLLPVEVDGALLS
ncbi:MAG: acetamidase/formamidase family protein, partial [Nitriliruptorales bacterium]|nr:acetamidase/formamidase family protein [Nitriliruptorales bacterium]